jgi:hypothetical protein
LSCAVFFKPPALGTGDWHSLLFVEIVEAGVTPDTEGDRNDAEIPSHTAFGF